MSRLDLIPFRQLLDRPVAPARRIFARAVWPVAAPIAAVGVAFVLAQSSLMQVFLGDLTWNQMLFGMAGYVGALFGLGLVVYLGYAAMASAALDVLHGRDLSMRRAWAFALRPSVVGTLIVLGLVTMLSLLFCIVPFFVVVPLLSLVLPVMVVEGSTGLTALRRSADLVRWNPTGRWRDSGFLQASAMLVTGWAIQYGLALLVQGPFVVAQQVWIARRAVGGQAVDPLTLAQGSLWINLPAQVLGSVATATAWLYWSFAFGMLYLEIRRRREAQDLESAIGRLVAG
ncbi:MAG: hypothetical protein AAGC60_14660 [Acidobacteriota bacterium]